MAVEITLQQNTNIKEKIRNNDKNQRTLKLTLKDHKIINGIKVFPNIKDFRFSDFILFPFFFAENYYPWHKNRNISFP